MSRVARFAPGALCLALWLAAAGLCEAATTRDLWVEVWINKVQQADFAMVHLDLRGHLYVRAEDFHAWRMRARVTPEHGLIRIDDVPGLRVRLSEEESVLRMEAEPYVFSDQQFNSMRRPGAPQPGMAAVFLNYSLFAEQEGREGTTYSALMQGGSSWGRASFTSSWLGTQVSGAESQNGWHRLDTDLVLDFPEDTARLTFGDGITGAGTLGASLRFTGVHWGTDFSTRPGFIPYALPVVTGGAAVPSSVDLYIDQALVQRINVDAGPFQLNNIPIPVGEGTVDIRMRDMLGQEQSFSMPYLIAPQLIAAGLTVFDFEAGAARENYGIDDFSYGRGFVSGSVQYGASNSMTTNVSGELVPQSEEATLRGGAALRVTRNLVLEMTPALSYVGGRGAVVDAGVPELGLLPVPGAYDAGSIQGAGVGIDAGIDALWPTFQFGVHVRDASPEFVELASLTPGGRLHTEIAAQVSAQAGRAGSLSVLYARRRSYDAPPTAVTTLDYNVSFRHLGSIGTFVSSVRGDGIDDVVAGVTFTRYLGKGVTASATGTSANGDGTLDMRIGRSAPPDSGWGWELAHAGGNGLDTTGGRLDARSAYGSGSAEIDKTSVGTLSIAGWQGGFLWAGGRPWPAQSLTSPAALLQLPDLGNVEVLHDGQPVGRTDSQGRILVPYLRPFEDNTITVVPEDLPLTALLDNDHVVVRPYSHGVVKAVMAVTGSESQVFAIHQRGGAVVPAGAMVTLGEHSFPVGTEGIAQIPIGHEPVGAQVSWDGGHCKVRVPALATLPAQRRSLAAPLECHS